jgi:CDP-6-deoxy-D-xylo-4-hexulose-3-dehydrase
MGGRKYRVSGALDRTDAVMNKTFWIGVQPALTTEMLDHAGSRVASYLGVEF